MADELTLSRVVPETVKTVRFLWVQRRWMNYQTYRLARERMRTSVQKTCSWCHHRFTDENDVSLAAPKRGRNTLLCDDCAAAAGAKL